jgi:hypothetical protein
LAGCSATSDASCFSLCGVVGTAHADTGSRGSQPAFLDYVRELVRDDFLVGGDGVEDQALRGRGRARMKPVERSSLTRVGDDSGEVLAEGRLHLRTEGQRGRGARRRRGEAVERVGRRARGLACGDPRRRVGRRALLFALLARRIGERDPHSVLPDKLAWLAAVAGCGIALAGAHLGFALVVVLAAFCLLAAFRLSDAETLWAGAGVALGVSAAVYLDPIRHSRTLGSFAVVLAAAAGAMVLLHGAAALAARRQPRWKAWFLPQRVPVLTLLVAWIAAAATLEAATAHQARTVAAPVTQRKLADAVTDWLEHRGTAPGQEPMVLVAASGGGSKAAYWTDLVLDCLAGDGVPAKGACRESPRAVQRRRALFLTSSASGGSVGVYQYLTHLKEAGTSVHWVDATTGRDVLSPTVAWGAFHDAPVLLLGMRTDPRDCTDSLSCAINADRALVQEAAVAGFKGGGIVPAAAARLQTRAPDQLVSVFNAAVSGGEGRVLLSPLQLAPPRPPHAQCQVVESSGEPAASSVDAYDMLKPGEDVPLVTAAMLSARFPVIAPAGRLGDAPDKGGCQSPPLPPLSVRDGGYIENTGLLTITELIPTIEQAIRSWNAQPGHADTRVQLIVISIDDDPTVLEAAPPGLAPRPGPLSIVQQAGPAYLSRLARARLTSCQYPHVTYFRISPPLRPGAHAATGWDVSTTAREKDLADALRKGPAMGLLAQLRRILDGSPQTNC